MTKVEPGVRVQPAGPITMPGRPKNIPTSAPASAPHIAQAEAPKARAPRMPASQTDVMSAIAMPINPPIRIKLQSISAAMTPCASDDINPAWGAGNGCARA